ncbi:MAG: AEC family transporter [Clostridiales bacterium]|nr:AEC family transporter [Clostridiales bacterium]
MYAKYFVLFAILLTGWFLKKIDFIDDKMNHSINKLIVYFAYPCLIVHNIGSLDMNGKIISEFLITFVISLLCFYIYGFICLGYGKARKFPPEVSNTAEFAMSTPNNGFMGFPVSLIFFGETGLLLMIAHNAAMNFYIFTYGMGLMNRNKEEKKKLGFKEVLKAILKFLLNPNILALFIGFILSIFGGIIPDAVDEYLLYIGNISTPMAMIFIGSNLAGYKFFEIIKDTLVIEAGLMKLIWLPLITLGLVYFLPVDGIIKSIVVLGISFPTAATVSMLAEQEHQNTGVASKILLLSTAVSIVTVPGVINLLSII